MSAIAGNSVRVEQMLHGYSGGHRLLSSSCSLSKHTERYTRMMSDLSGASFKAGFDGYLTGYPLEEDAFFAIAKTWFAKELPRPACVWTHTLLIPFEELGCFEAFEELLRAFRQPRGEDFNGYSEPLVLPSLGEGVKTRDPFDYVAHVIDAIYSHPDAIVALPSKSAEEHEALLLAIWRQQWPSLRCHFSFCTGALELRVGENRLDLQVMPDDKRLVQKASMKAMVVELNGSHDSIDDEAWMALATRDLIDEGNCNLKMFLESYADDEHWSRADFRRYCVCFGELSSKKPFQCVAATVAEEFPNGNDAKKLKVAIAGPIKRRAFFENAMDVEILRTLLLRNKKASAFDLNSLEVSDRFSELWTNEEEEAWHLLIEVADSKQSDFVGYLIEGIARIVSKDSIVRMALERCDLAAKVVQNNLSLAVVSEVWKCSELTLSSLADEFVDQAKSQEDSAKSVVTAWVVADRQDCGRALADAIGPSIATLLLSSEPSTLSLMDRLGGEWHSVLRHNGDACLDWLRNHHVASAEAACLATLGMTPSKGGFDSAVLAAWQKANSKTPELTRRTLHHAYVTMLVVAFDNVRHDVAESIVCVCFPTVYEAAMQNELFDHYWEMLRGRLPQNGLWWDRCKRLRMSLLDYCVKNDWSVETFIRCTSVGFALEQVLGSWGFDDTEKTFLGEAIRGVINGGSVANMDQKSAAERYSYRF